MKTIKISVGDKQSIDDAIKELEQMQDELEKKIYPKIREKFCVWITNRADYYLDLYSGFLGANVINDIKSKWSYDPSDFSTEKIIIRNTSEKAVFVEFGVGKTGANSPHLLAAQSGYQYNLPSIHKHAGKHHLDPSTFRFLINDTDDLDLLSGNYEAWQKASGELKIITTGSPSIMYAYKAIVDAINDVRYGSGDFEKYWIETLEEYWG